MIRVISLSGKLVWADTPEAKMREKTIPISKKMFNLLFFIAVFLLSIEHIL